jgi:hypothetical protein
VTDLAKLFAVLRHIVQMVAVLVIDVRLNTTTLSFDSLPVHEALKAQVTVMIAAHTLSKGCNTGSIAASTVARFVAVITYGTVTLTAMCYQLVTALVDTLRTEIKYFAHGVLLVAMTLL